MFSPLNDPQVKHWFQRLEAAWWRMPAEERAKQREEMQQHLEALVTAKIVEGESVEDAWNAALKQFGNPVRIGRKIYQEWRRNRVGFHADMQAILFGVRLNVLVGFVIGNILWQGFMPIPWFISIPIFLISGAGVLTYAPIGRKYPYHAIKSAFYTVLLCDTWRVAGSIVANHYQLGGIPQLGIWPINPPAILMMSLGLVFYVTVAYLASVTKRGWYKPTLDDFRLTLPKRRQISR